MMQNEQNCIASSQWIDERTLELQLAEKRLRLCFLEPGLVRCQYVTGVVFEKIPSYGRALEYCPLALKISETSLPTAIELHTDVLTVRVRKNDGGLEFYKRDDFMPRLLCADAEGMGSRPQERTGDELVWLLKHMPPEAEFFGLGDKPCSPDMRGKRFEMWGSDHYKFKPESDPLYKSIPFFLCQHKLGHFGIFFDNSMRSYFDFGKERHDRILFGADGGVMDYYFIMGETPMQTVQSYTRLTGLPPMPPLWSLGYHQSKWSYMSAEEVECLAAEFRSRKLPCDAIHLDIHHLNEYQAITWNRKTFPDPPAMIARLGSAGFKCVSIVNPGIKINPDNYVWRSGFERNVFCRRHDGALLEGEVWPGKCTFPDFTSPNTRNWWASLFERQIAQYGIRGMWTDMNEPAIFPDKTFPDDTRHNYDGFYCSHLKAHNVYGQCMAMATRQGMERFASSRRPFVLSRAGFAGLQRIAATWTGDNESNWENLAMANQMVQRLSLSGVSFAGSDTGGFLGHPTPELFVRWMQLSVFHAFYRNHTNGEFGSQEPWSFGEEAENFARKALETRYQLLPYIYTQFQRYCTQGLPIVRSVSLVEGTAHHQGRLGDCFFFGDGLYVIPITQPHVTSILAYMPKGTWYSLWSDFRSPVSGDNMRLTIKKDHIPVYVRAGYLLARWPTQQFVHSHLQAPYQYDLWWAPDIQVQSSLYADDGEGFGYRLGQYYEQQFTYTSSQRSFTLTRETSGAYELKQSQILLKVHALPAAARVSVRVDDEETMPGLYDERGVLQLMIPARFRSIELSYEEGNA